MHKSLTNQTLLESLTDEAIIMLEGYKLGKMIITSIFAVIVKLMITSVLRIHPFSRFNFSAGPT